MRKKFGVKLLAVVLSLLLTMSSFPITVVYASGDEVTEIISAETGISFSNDGLKYTINEDDVVDFDGTSAEIDVKLKYKGTHDITSVEVDSDDLTATYDSTEKTYDYTVELLEIGKTTFDVVWTHQETNPENTSEMIDVTEEETFEITLSRNNVIRRSVTFKCGTDSATFKYVPGEAYSVFKADAEALLNDNETSTHTYSYDITWGNTAVDGKEFVATATRKTFNIATVETEVKLEGNTALSDVNANVSLVKSTADLTTLTDKAFVGGETEFNITLDNDLYKVSSVVSDTADEITVGASSSTATFTSKPSKLTVFVVLDKEKVSLALDTNKHFVDVDEKIAIETSKELPVELTYEINGTETAAESGKFAVNSATEKIIVKASYDYGVSGVTPFEIEYTNDNYFEAVPFSYSSSATPVNVDGKLYFKADDVVITTPTEITIEDADAQTVSGEEQLDTTFKYTLGQGKFTSTSFGDVNAIYVDNKAPVVDYTNRAVAEGEDNAAYTAFKADQKVSFTVTDVIGVKSVILTRPDTTTEDITGDTSFFAAVNGTYTLTVTDNVLGNSQPYTIDVKANDETAPVIADAVLPTTPTNEDSQTITFEVTENQSGFETEDITVDNGATAQKNVDGSVSVTVTDNGTYKIYITDNKGNKSDEKTFVIDNFDKNAPSASLNLPNKTNILKDILSAINVIFKNSLDDVKLELSITDIAQQGEKASYVGIKDNTAKYYVYTLTDDDIKDDGTIEVSAANKTAVKNLMIAEGEGVKSFAPETENEKINIVFGKYVVFVLAYDNAGNEIFAYSDGLVFDNESPAINVVYDETPTDTTDALTSVTDGATIYVNDAAALTASTVDPAVSGQFVSGIQLTKVKINGADWATNTVSENEKVLKEDVVKQAVNIALPTDDGKYEVEITVQDMCLNENTFTFTYYLDNNIPVPSDLTYEGGSVWSNSDVVSFKIDDVDAEGQNVVFTDNVTYTVSYDGANTTESKTASVNTVDNRYYIDSFLIKDGSYDMTVNVKGKDINGNEFVKDLTVSIKKDTEIPVATDFVLSVESSLLNKLSFGIFGKKTVNVLVNVTNNSSAAAANETIAPLNDTAVVTYKKNGILVEGETASLVSGENKYSFDLPYTSGDELTYTEFKILVEDNAGNKNTDSTEMTKDNTAVAPESAHNVAAIENIGIMLESNGADINQDSISDSIYTFGTTPFYNKDVTATYSVEDTESGINEVVINANGKSETISYDSAKTTKKVYTYAPESGTVKDGETVIISGAENEASDTNTYNIAFNTKDNALNEANDDWTINVDSLAPRVTASRENTESDVKVDSIETVFDVVDEHFFNSATNEYGVVTAVVKYNGEDKTLTIGGTTHMATFGTAIKLEYTDSDTVKLSYLAQGKYELQSIAVQDLVKNETNVDVSTVNSAVIIDRTVPTVTDITFENATLKDKFRTLSFGTFTKDSAKVTVNIKNDGTLPSYYKSDIVKDTIKIYEVKVNNSEEAEVAGTTEVKYTCTLTENKSKTDENDIESWTVEFIIPINEMGKLFIGFADKAGNELKRSDDGAIIDKAHNNVIFKGTIENSDVLSNFYISETQAPFVDIVPDAATIEEEAVVIKTATKDKETEHFIDSNNRLWFDRDVVIPIDIQDIAGAGSSKISGVYSVEIKVNNNAYLDKTVDTENDWSYSDGVYTNKATTNGADINSTPWRFNVNTNGIASGPEGEYKIDVKVVDYATNETNVSYTIYKDIEAPEVVDFRFSPINKDDTNDGNATVVVLTGDEEKNGQGKVFGYYFKDKTNVTVQAVDRNMQNAKEKNKNTGVKSITFYTVDYSDPDNIVTAAPIKKDATYDSGKYTATFVVDANFKGQIFAYATDNIDNSNHTDVASNVRTGVFKRSFTYGETTDDVEVVVPRKTILETEAHHEAEANHITYEVQTAASYKDAKGFDLYATDVKIKVTVKDEYAGIREGEVVITSDENRSDETSSYPFEVDNAGSVSNGWKIEKTDDNLVTQISKVITVKRDSNNIELSATMTDRAYNTSEKTLRKFSIDKTSPTVVVSYDNNSVSEGKYFKNARTATIKVTERNFDPSLFNVIKNGTRVNVSWSSSGNYNSNTNKEGTVYTAKLPFSTDGDYTLSINGVDRVHHAASVSYTGVAPKAFTVDLKNPVVKVTYSSAAQPKNSNYYSKPRTATIEVNEHNWNPSKFVFSLRMNDGSVQKPELKWTNKGDIHTATFEANSVSGDKYTLDFECKDRADRDADFIQNDKKVKDYVPDEFYVDQTNPTIKYNFNGNDTGSNKSATTNKEFASSVSLSDTYYDYVNVSIVGQAHNYHHNIRGNHSSTVDIDAIIEDISTDDKTKDDFYTLVVDAFDKAGNTTQITRYFAVNRNGSIFELGASAASIVEKKYSNNINELKELSIRERNIDPIDTTKTELKVSIGGKVTTLKAGTDYSVSASTERGGNGYYNVVYTINPSVFKSDARYKFMITTKDAAGNTSKNSSKKSIAPGSEDLPILSFIYDVTAPTIDINLDKTKLTFYPISANSYLVEFAPEDDASGIDYNSVTLSIGSGDKKQVVELNDEEYEFKFDEETGKYSFVLKGTNNDVTFNFKDRAGNSFEELVFKRISVTTNALKRFFDNTRLFIGVLVGIVALATAIIILIAVKKKKKDDEEEPTAE